EKGMVGLSTHNKDEVLEANSYPLSYIGLGAYRPTSTKDTTNILGEKILEIAKLSTHPVAIIGGVRLDDEIECEYKVIGSDICRYIKKKKKKDY
ncbi:MAG: thiamine phosphate synthase, partial [Epsilonproteobacteria bacterium]|nr:thiamine phosphate synthase [Campylobacterota bacterium]